MGALWQLLALLFRQGKSAFVLVFLISLLSVLIEICGLTLLYLVISGMLNQSGQIQVPVYPFEFPLTAGVLLLVGVYAFKFLFSIWQSRFLLAYCNRINYKITTQIIESYYSESTEVFKNSVISDALNKVFTIGGFFSETVFQSILVLFAECVLTLILVTTLFLFNFKILLLLALFLVPLCGLLIYMSRRKLKNMSAIIMNGNMVFHHSVMTLFFGMLDIKLSGRYAHFFKEFEDNMLALQKTRSTISLENSFPSKVLEFAVVLGIGLFFFMSFEGEGAFNQAPMLVAMATAAFRFVPSANRIIGCFQNLNIYGEYIRFILKTAGKKFEVQKRDATDLNKLQSLELRNIHFSYNQAEVLNGVTLKLEPGRILGLSGKSGAGKTTLVNIISGLLLAHKGEILLNGEPMTQEGRENLLHKSAYLMQDAFFMNATIRENVVFGFAYDSQKMAHCLRLVNMQQWVLAQPLGIETSIGENATKLSGGQKQRLAIARALYRESALLILDEPSNALDSENKEDILSVVKNLTLDQKLITILVSHDPSVLKAADEVYTLEHGILKIKE